MTPGNVRCVTCPGASSRAPLGAYSTEWGWQVFRGYFAHGGCSDLADNGCPTRGTYSADPVKLSKVVYLYAWFSRSVMPTFKMRQVLPGVGDSAPTR
jgi:hypothetical protein